MNTVVTLVNEIIDEITEKDWDAAEGHVLKIENDFCIKASLSS